MKIQCPNCKVEFTLNDSITAKRFKCAKCKTVFQCSQISQLQNRESDNSHPSLISNKNGQPEAKYSLSKAKLAIIITIACFLASLMAWGVRSEINRQKSIARFDKAIAEWENKKKLKDVNTAELQPQSNLNHSKEYQEFTRTAKEFEDTNKELNKAYNELEKTIDQGSKQLDDFIMKTLNEAGNDVNKIKK